MDVLNVLCSAANFLSMHLLSIFVRFTKRSFLLDYIISKSEVILEPTVISKVDQKHNRPELKKKKLFIITNGISFNLD